MTESTNTNPPEPPIIPSIDIHDTLKKLETEVLSLGSKLKTVSEDVADKVKLLSTPVPPTIITTTGVSHAFLTKTLLILIAVCALIFGTIYVADQIADYKAKVVEAQMQEKAAAEQQKISDANNKARIDALNEYMKSVAANQKAILDIAAKQASIDKSIATRDKNASNSIDEVAGDNRTKEQSLNDLSKHLDISAKLINNDYILTQPDIKKIVAVEIDRQRLKGDLEEVNQKLVLEQDKVKTLTAELQRAIDKLNESSKTIEDYRKLAEDYRFAMESYKQAAVKSKWQKARDISLKIGLVVGSAYIGSLVAHP